MKQFFKQVLAVVVGFFLIAIVGTFFLVSIVAGLSASSKQEVQIEDNSILKLNLAYTINDKNSFAGADLTSGKFEMKETLGLSKVLKTIETAKNDDRIKGIYLQLSTMPNGFATTDAIRRALLDFKSNGKFIMAYGEYVSQKAYYLASVADNIYINPEGLVAIRGIGAQLTFFKRFLDKIEADVQVFKVGSFKSAVEPFIREDISEPNRKQLEFLLGGIKEDFIHNISEARAMNAAQLDSYINQLAFSTVDTSVSLGLIDGAKYYDEVLDELKLATSVDDVNELEFVSLDSYANSIDFKSKDENSPIAVVFAEGEIVSNADDEKLSSEEYAEIISELRQKESIKAIVLRVNSPGGSALASEVIWREIEKAKESKKVVVSMGNVAASGGYYISCNADYIFAEENTITGSIGVFGLVPNVESFLANKVGVTFDEVNLNEHANMNGMTNKFDDYERMVVQKGVDKVYETFTKRVAEGRSMHQDSIKVYAEGRVWTGEQAKNIGFVDSLGGLQDAIDYAAELISLEDYTVVTYPKEKSPVEEVLKNFGIKSVKQNMLKEELGLLYPYYEQGQALKENFNVVQAKMPYSINIE